MNKIRNFITIIYQELPFLFSMPAIVWQIIFFCVPLILIFFMGFFDQWSVTLQFYFNLLQPMYVRIILRSMMLATCAAGGCFLLGYPVAYYLAFHARALKNILLFFLILPFWTNFLVQMYAWGFVLEKQGLINNVLMWTGIIQEPLVLLNTLPAVALVMMYCYLPFMVMPMYVVLEKIDPTLIEASQDLGASARHTFFRIILPLSAPGIITGFFLVFVPAFGEFAIPILIGGNKYMTVGGLISHLFISAQDVSVGSAFTCCSSAVLLVATFLIISVIRKKSGMYHKEQYNEI